MPLTEFLGKKVKQREIEVTSFELRLTSNSPNARFSFSYPDVDVENPILGPGDIVEFEGYEGKPVMIERVSEYNDYYGSFVAYMGDCENRTPYNYGFDQRDLPDGAKIQYVGTLDLDFNDLAGIKFKATESSTTNPMVDSPEGIPENWLSLYLYMHDGPIYLNFGNREPKIYGTIDQAVPTTLNRTRIYLVQELGSNRYFNKKVYEGDVFDFAISEEMMQKNQEDIKNSLYVTSTDASEDSIDVESNYPGIDAANVLNYHVFPGDLFYIAGKRATVFTVDRDTNASTYRTTIYIKESIEEYAIAEGDQILFGEKIDPSQVTVLVEPIDASNEKSVYVEGRATNLEEGTTVEIKAADSAGKQVAISALTDIDGDYAASMDLSDLQDGDIVFEVVVTDKTDTQQSAHVTRTKDTKLPGTITVSATGATPANVTALPVMGSTTDIPEGEVVSLAITDSDGVSVSASTQTEADGTYGTTVDVSGLAEGGLSIEASVTDQRGDTQAATANIQKDALKPGTISATFTDQSPSDLTQVGISGTTKNVLFDSVVSITVTDSENSTTSATANTTEDGTYSVTLDLSAMADGTLTMQASVEDETGAIVSDTSTMSKSTVVLEPGSISLHGEDVTAGNASGVSVTGSTENVPTGASIAVTATDESGERVSGTATVRVEQTYSLSLDLAGLTDGAIELAATTIDETGTEVSGFDTIHKDTLEPGQVTVVAPAVTPENVTSTLVSGETSHVPAGESLTIVISDEVGGTVTGSVPVGEDGSVALELDLSGLVDGVLSIAASVVDELGKQATGHAVTMKDALKPGAIEVQLPFVNRSNVATCVVSGSTTNVPASQSVTVSVVDDGEDAITGYAPITDDGTYSVSLDLTALSDGTLTATAEVTDETGEAIYASSQAEKDALLPGSIDAAVEEITKKNMDAALISGTTTNVPAGSVVSITVTDSEFDTATGTTKSGEAGTYSMSLDLSELQDGDLSVDVFTSDETGATVSATLSTSKDTGTDSDFTLSNLQTHYGSTFPTNIKEYQFESSKQHTLNYVKTFLIAAKLELDEEVYAYIKEAIWDIVHYKIWLNVGTPSESVSKKNDMAIQWLKDIAKGNVRVKSETQESRKKGFHTIQLLR